MRKRLTLVVKNDTVENIKAFAKNINSTVPKIVEDYFKTLNFEKKYLNNFSHQF